MTRRSHRTNLTGTQYWRRILGTLFLFFLIGSLIAGAVAAAGITSQCLGDLIRAQFDLPDCIGKVAFAYVLFLIFKWGTILFLAGILMTVGVDLFHWVRRYFGWGGSGNWDTDEDDEEQEPDFTKAPF